MVELFRHQSAAARVCELRDCVFEVAYSGVLTAGSFDALRGDVLAATSQAAALVIRMESGLIAMPEIRAIPRSAYSNANAPGAVVVRPDQMDYWSVYGESAAEIGVIRAVFLDRELAMARDWSSRHALFSLSRSRQLPG